MTGQHSFAQGSHVPFGRIELDEDGHRSPPSGYLKPSRGSPGWSVTVLHYDPLGRKIRTELPAGTEARVEFSPWAQRRCDCSDSVLGSTWHSEHNHDEAGADVFTETRTKLDVSGNVLRVVDANGIVAEERTYGMLGQMLRTSSIEVGQRRQLVANGQPKRRICQYVREQDLESGSGFVSHVCPPTYLSPSTCPVAR